jgi:regulation of enolase protein 1 (concanavalin A-like superfamily)
MSWLNEPFEWSLAGDILTVCADPETDFWRTTHYGFVRDNGHFLPTGQLGLRFRGEFATQYDQAGLMLRLDSEHWIKAGIELDHDRLWLSVVVTNGVSDWSQQPAPAPDAEGWWTIRAERDADSIQLWAGDQPIRLAPFPSGDLLSGPMCAAPKGPGFTCSFAPLT